MGKVSYPKQPSVFPGFSSEDEDLYPMEGNTAKLAEERAPEGDEAPAEDQVAAAAGVKAEEPAQKREPVQLTDDALVIDPDTGTPVTWKEIREARMRQADYTRKTQELAADRNLLDFYKSVPEFREVVDREGKKIYAKRVLGVDVAGTSGVPEKEDGKADPEWVKKFDDNPRATLDEWGTGLTKKIQEDYSRALNASERKAAADAVWQMLEAELDADFPVIYKQVSEYGNKLASTDPAAFQQLNNSPAKVARLVRGMWAEYKKKKETSVDQTKPKGQGVAPARSVAGNPDEKPKNDDAPWKWSKDRFDAFKKKVRGV